MARREEEDGVALAADDAVIRVEDGRLFPFVRTARDDRPPSGVFEERARRSTSGGAIAVAASNLRLPATCTRDGSAPSVTMRAASSSVCMQQVTGASAV
jgi:hypothetical protein